MDTKPTEKSAALYLREKMQMFAEMAEHAAAAGRPRRAERYLGESRSIYRMGKENGLWKTGSHGSGKENI